MRPTLPSSCTPARAVRAVLPAVAAILMLAPTLAPAQATTGTMSEAAHRAKVRRVLATTPLVDGHNDLPGYIRSEFPQAPRDVEAYDLRKRTPGNTVKSPTISENVAACASVPRPRNRALNSASLPRLRS